MDVGTHLRRALEAGLSLEQLSRLTGLHLAEIEALEKNAYARVQLHGFLEEAIDRYARAVGLDPKVTLELMRAQSHGGSVAGQPGLIIDVDPLFLSEGRPRPTYSHSHR